ncbi:MAG: hypothetical protein H6815_10800 [Phycisphaeraceae bacterium]|nr:hypothetical protein [Phycisphaerales bacterium]MCB9860923.1 hypothetical protein [Phycisphaeraceae bacterium]
MRNDTRMIQFIACGLAGSVASVASAQTAPFLINGSGATLLQALFEAPASTNDFIDVDGDTITGEQLAPTDLSFPWLPDQYWQVTYRIVGSGNGLAELRDWGFTYATLPDGDPGNGTFNCSFSDKSIWNREAFCLQGAGQPISVGANPGGTPVRSLMDGSFQVSTSTDPLVAGLQMNFAALDVPVSWFVSPNGQEQYNRVPGAPGYGLNPRVAVNKDGTAASQSNKLKSLSGLNGDINVNTANPDDHTVFDTAITLAPVGAIVNYGVGMSEIDMSDLRHLAATGRRINGENLMKITRDSGSGTRNAFMNGIGLDPSWGVGENIGDRTVSSANDLLGPDFQPSNKGSSGRMDNTTLNHRLAVGHTGTERGESSGWLIAGNMDFLAVRSDIKGGTVYARPTLTNLLDAGVDGYNIIGPGGIATMGDPRSDSAATGGWGWDPSETGAYPNPVQPPANPNVSAYVNNITRSTSAFVAIPGGSPTLFSPGEYLASQFLLFAATDNVPVINPNPASTYVPIVANPDKNQALQTYILNQSGNVHGLPAFQTFNTNTAGRVPGRTTGVVYSDGVANGDNYINQAGNTVLYGTSLNMRNKIAYDFNGDGVRDINDAEEMMKAWHSRNGGPAWVAPDGTGSIAGTLGSEAIIEVLGDGNGDGNFDAEDLRYWADGLVIDGSTGCVNRVAGFTAVDNASASVTGNANFFGTTWASGQTYAAGDSRFDISNTAGLTTRGFAPTGADGVIDANDSNYVMAQFTGNPFVTDGEATWDDIAEAVGFDFSADMNGDCVVDQDDVDAFGGVCYADCDGSGSLNIFDYICFGNAYAAGLPYADCDGSGSLNIFDYICFGNEYAAGCP